MLLQQRLPICRVLEEHRAESAVNTSCNCSPQHRVRQALASITLMKHASHTSAWVHSDSHFFCCFDAGQTCSVGDLQSRQVESAPAGAYSERCTAMQLFTGHRTAGKGGGGGALAPVFYVVLGSDGAVLSCKQGWQAIWTAA